MQYDRLGNIFVEVPPGVVDYLFLSGKRRPC